MSASIVDLDIYEGTYDWIGGSAWDWCDECDAYPTEEQKTEMQRDINRQIVEHFWPELSGKIDVDKLHREKNQEQGT